MDKCQLRYCGYFKQLEEDRQVNKTPTTTIIAKKTRERPIWTRNGEIVKMF